MKNIVVCADGTWNDPTDRTNVFKLFGALEGDAFVARDRSSVTDHYLEKESEGQTAFYLEGVGAQGAMNLMLAGATGIGLHSRVLDGYILASRAYEPGDKIYIFGFSRGAYTARGLAGLIATGGLMTREEANDPTARVRANAIWWKAKHGGAPDAHGPDRADEAPIRLVGVWDTVGALGIPSFNGVKLVDALEQQLFDFADTDLSTRVEHGRHAVSIDSKRRDFEPSLWAPRENVEQLWFVGVHSDVGGGYPEAGLSDVAYVWMVEEAAELGLRVRENWREETAPDATADRHESSAGRIWQLRGTVPRTVPPDAKLHASVLERFEKRRDYRPFPLRQHPAVAAHYVGDAPEERICTTHETRAARALAVGESTTVDVSAETWWNAAGVRVEAKQTYRIDSTGEWTDWHTSCSTAGYESATLALLRPLRRVRAAPWFALIACVNEHPDLDDVDPSILREMLFEVERTDRTSQLSAVGELGEIVVDRGGYLYLFANDTPLAYGNNCGAITANITRTA